MRAAQLFGSGLLVLGLITSVTRVGAEEAIVLHPTAAVAALSDDQLKDLFLGKRASWDDGAKVIVVVVKEGPAAMALMRRLGRSPQQFQTGWKKLVFTGRGAMPEVVDDEAALVAYVARTPGAIGLVDRGKIQGAVKVLAVP